MRTGYCKIRTIFWRKCYSLRGTERETSMGTQNTDHKVNQKN